MVGGSRDGGGVQPHPRAAYTGLTPDSGPRVRVQRVISKASYRQAYGSLRRKWSAFASF
jgi:hypothetical protein